MLVESAVPDAPDDLLPSGLPVQELFGIPVHALVVHSALVLLPVAAIGLILMASGIGRSKRYGGAISLLALFGFVAGFLAMASGRDFASALGYAPQQHFELGAWVPWFGLALLACATLLWLLDKKPPKRGAPAKVIALVGIVVALASIVVVAWTGITGEQLTWA